MRICSQDSTKTSLISLKLALILVSYRYHYTFFKSVPRHPYKKAPEYFSGAFLVKNVSLYLCHRHTGRKLKYIGRHFNVGESAVSQGSRRMSMKINRFLLILYLAYRLDFSVLWPQCASDNSGGGL